MNILTIVGLGIAGIGTLMSEFAKDKERKEEIEEEVSKQLAEQNKSNEES